MGPVIGLNVAVGCQRSGGPVNHPGERDHVASESEMSPQIGLNSAFGAPKSGGLPEAPEEANFKIIGGNFRPATVTSVTPGCSVLFCHARVLFSGAAVLE
ncbi:unnamed protein product [Boreogadus saida]